MLEDAWDNAGDGANTLRAELRINEKAVGSLIASGQIQSVGKNSASQSYAFGTGALTLPQLAEAWRDLINLFDTCAGIVDSPATDDSIYAEMTARLRPRYSRRIRMTNLRNNSAEVAA